MNEPPSVIQDVGFPGLTAHLEWLLSKVRLDRAQWIIAQLTDRVERKRMADILAVQVVRDGVLAAGAIALLQPPDAATLLVLRGEEHETQTPPVQLTLDRLKQRLLAHGVRFLQASADPGDRAWTRLGFEHLADLAFLVLNQQDYMPSGEQAPPNMLPQDGVFEVVGPDPVRVQAVCQLAAATFEETLDCPQLSRYRDAIDIVVGYCRAPAFDPRLWQTLLIRGNPAGCLLLSRHGGSDSPRSGDGVGWGGALEISYMGLLPAFRGCGLGRVILRQAIAMAAESGAQRMVLAVDRANSPAMQLYRAFGWSEAGQESAWGMAIMP